MYAYTLLSQKFYFQSVFHRKIKCILKKQSVPYILLLLGTPSIRNAGYWTGYYTSRPALKRYERYANNILQVTRQLNGFSQNNQRNITFDLSKRKHTLSFDQSIDIRTVQVKQWVLLNIMMQLVEQKNNM